MQTLANTGSVAVPLYKPRLPGAEVSDSIPGARVPQWVTRAPRARVARAFGAGGVNTMLEIRTAQRADAALVLDFVRKLAEYERLLHAVVATEADVVRDLFGQNPRVFCDLVEHEGTL